ncbi:MAG: hypothetical protein JXJ22_14510 [Bacteroidales bacterium]|nr:hypothetical protein [Bacteroidales bacterium]
MKKVNLVRTLMSVAVAILVTNGVFAQVNDPSGNYVVYDAAAVAPADVEYVTVGATLGYFAEPDPVYHPSYNAGGSWTLQTGFVWNWTAPTDPGTAPTINKPGDANYATITYPVAGDYVINVAEESSAAFGGCADASPTVLNVTAIPAPSAQFSTADVTTGLCDDQPAASVVLAITESAPDALAAYSFTITEIVENIDAGGSPTATVTATHNVADFGLGAKAKTGTSGFAGTSPNFTYTLTSAALDVENNARTRYTYSVVSASGVTGTGIVSAISHKSDYLAGAVNAHAFGAKTTVVFIVNPAPSTGDIYHIPNTYSY